jgi:hypothetical protein
VSDQSPEARFEAIAARLLPEPGVERRRAFHNPGLTAGGRIFAMLVRGEMVVKLPAERCAGLVAAGAARPFDRGQGRPLREWVVLPADGPEDWLERAEEALAFARR